MGEGSKSPPERSQEPLLLDLLLPLHLVGIPVSTDEPLDVRARTLGTGANPGEHVGGEADGEHGRVSVPLSTVSARRARAVGLVG